MRVYKWLSVAGLMAALALPVHAQDAGHKAGGLTAVGQSISRGSRELGRGIKEGVKSAGGSVHQGLKSAGNDTKGFLKKTTGITSQSSHPGGLNKVARNVSRASKKFGSQVKSAVRSGKSEAHQALKSTGNSIKHGGGQ